MTDKEKALLNKIYRAAHDCVCPGCGNDLGVDHLHYSCSACSFDITHVEMSRIRPVVMSWGAEAVSFFQAWRKR